MVYIQSRQCLLCTSSERITIIVVIFINIHNSKSQFIRYVGASGWYRLTLSNRWYEMSPHRSSNGIIQTHVFFRIFHVTTMYVKCILRVIYIFIVAILLTSLIKDKFRKVSVQFSVKTSRAETFARYKRPLTLINNMN